MERQVRRWLIAWTAALMLPWLTALVWKWKTGTSGETAVYEQNLADEGVKAEQQERNLTDNGSLEAELQETQAKEAGSGEVSKESTAGEIHTQNSRISEETKKLPEEVRVLPERRVLLERNGAYTYVDLETYLPAVVLCQTELGMSQEALKCQAVIARTYICRLMNGQEEIEEKELNLNFPETFDRGLLGNRDQRDEMFAALEQCEKAVRETTHVVMKYEDRFILPLFHKISAGRTRTGEADFPYLQAAESSRDREADEYQTEFSWSVQEFIKKTGMISETENNSKAMSAEALASQIQIVKKDDSGYVASIKLGTKIYTGEEVQYALGLPSSCFSIFISQGKVFVRTFGVGHGYGLSQNGACAMAEDGWSYEEILHYYYKNISIVSE